MAHLTLQEVIDRVNHNYFYYSTGEQRRVQGQPHHPEYYVPRMARLFAGLVFGAFRAAAAISEVQKANFRT